MKLFFALNFGYYSLFYRAPLYFDMLILLVDFIGK